jgi:mycofactocin system FadH/OYE family oxidoreductase 2
MEPAEVPYLPHLFAPLQLGALSVRNRVLISGHQPGLADGGVPGERYIAYQRARAHGGAGLQITGATSVHPTGGYASPAFLQNLDDRIVPGYQRLAEVVHAEGGCILAQLAHAGALGHDAGHELPLWAPSPVPAELYREIPHVMTVDEIAEIVAAFGAAARRVREGELDGVEIQAAYGLLIAAFLSPAANQREDAYGGDLDGRMRFLLEVVDAVRAELGPDQILGIRLPGDERVPGGINLPQMQAIAQRLEATGKVDFLNIIAGTNLDRFERVRHWPPTPAPHGLFVPLAAAIKQVVSIPIFTVGRIVDPRHAEQILAAGQADMVGMTRAHIADPELVAKARAGRFADIRPCVGANVCIARVMDGAELRCIHNPETGREATWGALVPATAPRRIVVIGGGPAGLEAARVAAMRGHRVELFEREGVLGGQLHLWAQSPATAEFGRIIAWQEAQLRALDVTVHLGRAASLDDIRALNPDVVIVATGSHPKRVQLPSQDGGSLSVLAPHEVLAGQATIVARAVVWDEGGGQAALSAAEALAQNGVQVTIVTPGFAVGEDVNVTVRIPLYERLLSVGAVFLPNSRVVAVGDSTVIVRNLYSGTEEAMTGVGLLVAWHGGQADDGLVAQLRGVGISAQAVGDCVAPRRVDIAMAEGAQVARHV